MAKAKESSLWDWLSKARRELGPALHMTRIENYVEPGMPDVEGTFRLEDKPHQFWLELKSEDRPKRDGTPVRFDVRPDQVTWNAMRWGLGANNFWLLQVGSGRDRALYLAPGDLGSRLLAGLTETELAIECLATAIFKNQFSQIDVLTKAVTCRANKFLSPN